MNPYRGADRRLKTEGETSEECGHSRRPSFKVTALTQQCTFTATRQDTPLSVLCSALNENRKCIKQKAESLTCFMIIQNHIYESVFDAELYLAARRS